VVVGGMGSVFAEPRVTQLWHAVNTEVTEYVHARMKLEKLRYAPLVVPVEQLRGPDQPVIAAMSDLAGQIYRDLDASGTLAALRV
jgi:hypothetical protein